MGGLKGGRGTMAMAQRTPGALGVIMLETRFPRLHGDIGNPDSLAWPVRYEIVRGASPQRVIREGASGLLEPFVRAARRLVARGCRALTTSCGFLAMYQTELAAAVAVPVATSSLCQIAALDAGLAKGQRCGVITIAADALSPAHFFAVGAALDTPVIGVASDGEFARAILGDQPSMDAALLCAEVLAAGRLLLRRHPEVAAIVLECTNMPPYADALRAATGLPVYDVLTLAADLMAQSVG